MNKDWLKGNLGDFPFSFLLFRIWQYGLWGRLNIQNSEENLSIFFQNGNIILESGSFPQREFLNDLVKEEKISNRISDINLSASRLETIFEGFNTQCAYIYKYISKKIGPVSLNILRKCLQETKVHLPSLFQKVELDDEGRMDMKPILKSNVSLSSERTKTEILKGLNELLAAEVLCVKKTLGKEHESNLVKNLKQIREMNE